MERRTERHPNNQFCKTLSSETARLATLAIKITIEGSARAEWLQQQTDAVFFSIRKWVEYGCAYGTVVIKPNGKTLDVFTPDEVLITDYDNQNITGMIFKDTYTQGNGTTHDWNITDLKKKSRAMIQFALTIFPIGPIGRKHQIQSEIRWI